MTARRAVADGDDLREHGGNGREREIRRRRATGGNGRATLDGREAQPRDGERHDSGGNVAESVLAGAIGDRASRRSGDDDLNAADRSVADRVGHGSANDTTPTLLRCGGRRADRGKSGDRHRGEHTP